MVSALKAAFDKRGLERKDLRNKAGICYTNAYRHYEGLRKISAIYAIKYEEVFGIPRSELRPDLWTPAMFLYLKQGNSPNVATAGKD